MRTNKYLILGLKILLFWMLFFTLMQELALGQSGFRSGFPVQSTGSVRFDLDICQFEGGGDSTRIELFYSVYLTGKDTIEESGLPFTTLGIHINIINKSGAVVYQDWEEKEISLYDSLNPGAQTTYIDIKSVDLLPDSVFLQLTIQDTLTGKIGQVSGEFIIRSFGDEFSLSDLYFVSHVQRASGSSVFEKHGIMLVPHPSRSFFVSDDIQKAFVFYEINNLSYKSTNKSFFDAICTVFDIKGQEVFRNVRELIKINSNNTSRVEIIPVGKFKNGIYRLLVEVIDSASGVKRQISGYFKVVREDSDETDILPMTKEEAAKYYDQIKYIASQQEKEVYHQLNPSGKQEFLLRFWKSRDTDPSTPENEFMLEHFRRLAIAEEKFKGGINSDRGRIYIKYGPPVEIKRQPSSAGTSREIEIWIYAIEGRTDFVFVDRNGDGKYVLVHSNHIDEYSNPGWQEGL